MVKMNHQSNIDRNVCELDILGRTFLKHLLPFTKTYAYDGELQLLDLIDSETSNGTEHFLLSSGKESIETIVDPESTTDIPKFFSSFDLVEGLLLLTMPSQTHAAAIHEIVCLFQEKLTPMGLHRALQGFPGAEVKGETSTRSKQPDYGWCPKRTPRPSGPAKPQMPSIVLEVAYTENDKTLNLDVRYWLSPNDGNTKLCLTLRVDRKYNEIRMESWIRQEVDNNNHVTRIHRDQVVYARMTENGRAIVTGDRPFRIPFESLMLRPIDTAKAAEKDLMFTQADFKSVAQSIWNAE